MRDYHELKVWVRAHRLTIAVYRLTKGFPHDERFGLVQQMRRAAASIPTNIAEGAGLPGRPEFARFLGIAAASASELHYHLELSRDLGYIDGESSRDITRETSEVRAMLTALRLRVKSHAQHGS